MTGPAMLISLLALEAALFVPGLSLSDYTQALLAPFKAYPVADKCGRRYMTSSTVRSCPIDTCPAEREACLAADNERKDCKKKACPLDALAAATQKATEACDAAAKCVRSECYNTAPIAPNATIGACKVRSFYSGTCCCPTCSPDRGLRPLDAEFTIQGGWPPSATTFEGLHAGQIVSIDGKTELFIGGPAGAMIYSIRMQRLKGDPWYTHQVVIDAMGPQGVYAPDWIFIVRDSSGSEFSTLIGGGRGIYTLPYSSDNPTIMSFSWPAGKT